MKSIPLTQGKAALVDDSDYERLSQWKWCAARRKHLWYAVRSVRVGLKTKTIQMHNEILGVLFVDHEDGDGLNNQRLNLRPADRSQNSQNQRHLKSGKSSRFKGVCRFRDKWQALICVRLNGEKKRVRLGIFEDEVEAAIAYDAAAKKHFGQYAATNL